MFVVVDQCFCAFTESENQGPVQWCDDECCGVTGELHVAFGIDNIYIYIYG